jgi:hypothetical protein
MNHLSKAVMATAAAASSAALLVVVPAAAASAAASVQALHAGGAVRNGSSIDLFIRPGTDEASASTSPILKHPHGTPPILKVPQG